MVEYDEWGDHKTLINRVMIVLFVADESEYAI